MVLFICALMHHFIHFKCMTIFYICFKNRSRDHVHQIVNPVHGWGHNHSLIQFHLFMESLFQSISSPGAIQKPRTFQKTLSRTRLSLLLLLPTTKMMVKGQATLF